MGPTSCSDLAPTPSPCYPSRPMHRLHWLALLWLSATACGYTWVRPVGRGPVGALRLGEFNDLTAEGDLGLILADVVRTSLAGRKRPRVTTNAGPRLGGTVTLAAQRPAGFDRERISAAYEAVVRVHLVMKTESEVIIWRSGPIDRRALYFRGRTPLETLAARRNALLQAIRRAGEDALARLITSSPRVRRKIDVPDRAAIRPGFKAPDGEHTLAVCDPEGNAEAGSKGKRDGTSILRRAPST